MALILFDLYVHMLHYILGNCRYILLKLILCLFVVLFMHFFENNAEPCVRPAMLIGATFGKLRMKYINRRVYHIVTDHAFWVESIVTYHRIYRKKCIT